jgi:hypothetical protein
MPGGKVNTASRFIFAWAKNPQEEQMLAVASKSKANKNLFNIGFRKER